MELDVGHAALLVQQRVRVHAKALHVAVVGRDADVVLQEGELRRAARTVPAIPDTRAGAAYRRSQQTLLAGRRPALFTRAERCAHLLFRPRTMCMLSGWCEKKSAMRQFSWMWFLGLGLSACTMSGNLMPSRTKNTCRARGAAQALRGRHDRRGRGCSPSGSGPASRRARPLRARQGRIRAGGQSHTHTQVCVARLTTCTLECCCKHLPPASWHGGGARHAPGSCCQPSPCAARQVATVSQLSASAASRLVKGSRSLHRF